MSSQAAVPQRRLPSVPATPTRARTYSIFASSQAPAAHPGRGRMSANVGAGPSSAPRSILPRPSRTEAIMVLSSDEERRQAAAIRGRAGPAMGDARANVPRGLSSDDDIVYVGQGAVASASAVLAPGAPSQPTTKGRLSRTASMLKPNKRPDSAQSSAQTASDKDRASLKPDINRSRSVLSGAFGSHKRTASQEAKVGRQLKRTMSREEAQSPLKNRFPLPKEPESIGASARSTDMSRQSSSSSVVQLTEAPTRRPLTKELLAAQAEGIKAASHRFTGFGRHRTTQISPSKSHPYMPSIPPASAGLSLADSRAGPSTQAPAPRPTFDPARKRRSITPRAPPSSSPSSTDSLAIFREMAAVQPMGEERVRLDPVVSASASSQRPKMEKASPVKTASFEGGTSSQREVTRQTMAVPSSQRPAARAPTGAVSAARQANLRDRPASRAGDGSTSRPSYDDGVIRGSSRAPAAAPSSARARDSPAHAENRPLASDTMSAARRDWQSVGPVHPSQPSEPLPLPQMGSQRDRHSSRTRTADEVLDARRQSTIDGSTPRLLRRVPADDDPSSSANDTTPRADPPRRAAPADVRRDPSSRPKPVHPLMPVSAAKSERSDPLPLQAQSRAQRIVPPPTQKRKRSGENEEDDAFRPSSQAVRTPSSRTSSGEQTTRAKRARPPAGSMAVPSYDAPEEAWSKDMSGRPRAKPVPGHAAAVGTSTAPAPAPPRNDSLSASSTLSSLPSTASPIRTITTPRPLRRPDGTSREFKRTLSAAEQGLADGAFLAARGKAAAENKGERMDRMASSSLTELGSQTTPSRRAAREDEKRGAKSKSKSASGSSLSPLKRVVALVHGTTPELKHVDEGTGEAGAAGTEAPASPRVDAVSPVDADPFAEFAEYEFKEFSPEPVAISEQAPRAAQDTVVQRPATPMALPSFWPAAPRTPESRARPAVPRTVHVERRRLQPYSPVQRKQRMSLSPTASRRTLSILTVSATSITAAPERESEPAPPVELTPREMALKREVEREAMRVLERQKAAERRAAVEADIARRTEAEQADEESDEGSADLLKAMQNAAAGSTLAVPSGLAPPGARRSSRLGSATSDVKAEARRRSRSPSATDPLPRPKRSVNPLLATLRQVEREKRLGLWDDDDEAASPSASGSDTEGSDVGLDGGEDEAALLDRVGKFAVEHAADGEKLDSALLRSMLTKKGRKEEGWTGFWEDEYVVKGQWTPEVVLPAQDAWLEPFVAMARAGDFGPLGYVISGLEVSPAIVGFVLDTALCGSISREMALALLPRVLMNASDHPFGSSSALLGRLIGTIQSLGARDIYMSLPADNAVDLDSFRCGVGRVETCYVLAIIVREAAENRWLDMADAVVLAPTLLMLAMDPSVMYTPLGRAVRGALAALWPLCMDCLAPVEMARVLCEFIAKIPASYRWLAFETIGSGSPQAREVARWVGMEIVIPDILSRLSGDRVLVVPSAEMLYDAASCVLQTVLGRSKSAAIAGDEGKTTTPSAGAGGTDHVLLRAQVAGLYAAMNDIEETLGTTPGKVAIVRERFERVGAMIKRASDLIKRNSLGAVETLNKMHLGQLAAVLSMQVKTALERRKRVEERARLRGSGLKLGSGGGAQTVLAFKKRKRAVREAEVGDAGLGGPEGARERATTMTTTTTGQVETDEDGRAGAGASVAGAGPVLESEAVREGVDASRDRISITEGDAAPSTLAKEGARAGASDIRTGSIPLSGSTDATADVEMDGAGVDGELLGTSPEVGANDGVVAGGSGCQAAQTVRMVSPVDPSVEAGNSQLDGGWARHTAISAGVR